jgi:hypothetical protein
MKERYSKETWNMMGWRGLPSLFFDLQVNVVSFFVKTTTFPFLLFIIFSLVSGH